MPVLYRRTGACLVVAIGAHDFGLIFGVGTFLIPGEPLGDFGVPLGTRGIATSFG